MPKTRPRKKPPTNQPAFGRIAGMVWRSCPRPEMDIVLCEKKVKPDITNVTFIRHDRIFYARRYHAGRRERWAVLVNGSFKPRKRKKGTADDR